jgi:type I restriction enzyme R subunit
MLLRDELEEKLAQFNPWMSADAVRSIVEDPRCYPADYRGEPRHALLAARRTAMVRRERKVAPISARLIDFEHSGANAFHVSWEWALKPPARKGNRANVMFLVNGLPVCIVEHKNSKDGGAIERAIKQLRRYELETPELIGAPISSTFKRVKTAPAVSAVVGAPNC